MPVFNSKLSVLSTVPDKQVMLAIVERIVELEGKTKRGEQLTRVEEASIKELNVVCKAMKKVQKSSVSRLPNLSYVDYHESS
tara:strand:- start:645 stop:890 length:246 start_codon:yes stop_codon:yes gene_type:complete